MNEGQYKKKMEHFLEINNKLYSEILKLKEENNKLKKENNTLLNYWCEILVNQ
jgi:hypothetical protein